MTEINILMKALKRVMRNYPVNIEVPVGRLFQVIEPLAHFLRPVGASPDLSALSRQIVKTAFICELQFQVDPRARLMYATVPLEIEKSISIYINHDAVRQKACEYRAANTPMIHEMALQYASSEEAIAGYITSSIMDAIYAEVDLLVLKFIEEIDDANWRIYQVSDVLINENILIVADHGDYRVLDWERIQEEKNVVADD